MPDGSASRIATSSGTVPTSVVAFAAEGAPEGTQNVRARGFGRGTPVTSTTTRSRAHLRRSAPSSRSASPPPVATRLDSAFSRARQNRSSSARPSRPQPSSGNATTAASASMRHRSGRRSSNTGAGLPQPPPERLQPLVPLRPPAVAIGGEINALTQHCIPDAAAVASWLAKVSGYLARLAAAASALASLAALAQAKAPLACARLLRLGQGVHGDGMERPSMGERQGMEG